MTALTAAADAGVVDVWTTYSGMAACKSGLPGAVNNVCLGLRDGRAIGLVDASLAGDELEASLGLPVDDQNAAPAPEGPDNPVVEVWNNTNDTIGVAPGTSLAADVRAGLTVYTVPAHADLAGPPIDMEIILVIMENPDDAIFPTY